jgi:diguanylate cyclase (GGDEF)-like protein
MRKIVNFWRWYSLSREQYHENMKKPFMNNLYFLRYANIVAAILTACFALFPLVIERSLTRASGYIAAAIISLLLFVLARRKLHQFNQGKQISNLTIYLLITAYYANIILFGIYLGVWLNPGNFAVTFMCILICALFLFTISPQFNLCLTLGAMALFIASTVYVKTYEYWIIDIINVLGAGCISLFFGWQLTMWRLVSIMSTSRIENERDKYYAQSTIDELTGLRNRRDFEQTFQRFLTNYRTTDEWMCIAIADIDFFKNYNDHYGHSNGDLCLRSIGGALNNMRDSMGVYTARVGGEEFALLWFEKEASHVNTVVAKLTDLIKGLKIPHEKSAISPYVTLSIGIYIEKCGAFNDTRVLYELADKALYTAKNNGRNCAIVCGNEIEQYKITPANSIESQKT